MWFFTTSAVRLNPFEPWPVQYHATAAIPFDERVIFNGLLDCSTVAGRLSEVAQGLYAISGTKLPAGGRRAARGGRLARSESGVAPGCGNGGCEELGSLTIGLSRLRVIKHIHSGWRGIDPNAS